MPVCRSRAAVRMMSADEPPEKGGSEYSVDWDTAWSAELTKRNTGTAGWRPEGREPVSEVQLAKARFKKRADDVQYGALSASSKWQFWVGLLAVLSVGTALLQHPSDSYTI